VRTLPVLLAFAALAPAGTDPKPSAKDYPAHAAAGGCSLGAEYFARTIPVPGGGWSSGSYIVVEAAVFPPRGETVMVRASDFRLLLNGTRRELMPQTPGIVAASLKYPGYEGRRGLDAVAGVGPVIIGPRRDRTARFPGDPRGNPPLPAPPRAPTPEKPQPDEPPPTDFEAVVRFALEEGEAQTAASGLLYYAWKGKLKDIRRIDLVWLSPCGRITANLQ
jgi:hypothetical protein